ncbi:hypothetical protein JCM8547_002597 [Rhodosporidiobolus lusitaniae]
MPFKLAVATVTLGRAAAGHDLRTKLRVASEAGYDGIELTYECFADYHASLGRQDDLEERKKTARTVKEFADALHLAVISLQPFMNYDALHVAEAAARLEIGKEWVQLCVELGARWLQIPSSIYPLTPSNTTSNVDEIVANMVNLADYATSFGVELAYEAPSWGVALQTWQQIDEIIDRAARPNIRHCLDTFHIATHELNDPKTLAVLPNGPARLASSVLQLARLKPEKIAYVQLSDGCSVDLTQTGFPVVDLAQPAFCTWSRYGRCHPYDGGHPVAQIAKAFFDAGFEGWVSLESFHTDLCEKDTSVPQRWAQRGVESWQRIKKECGI